MQRIMQLSAVNGILNSLDAQLGIVTSFAKHGDQPSIHRILGIYWPAKQLLASQQDLFHVKSLN